MYGYGLIGNCEGSALVSSTAGVDWLCLPRPDSAPVFGKLLDPQGGEFRIELRGEGLRASQTYHPNTNVLITELTNAAGDACRVTDFFPRYLIGTGLHRPLRLVRILTPEKGTPTLRVHCTPVAGWEKTPLRSESRPHQRIFRHGRDCLTLSSDADLEPFFGAAGVALTRSVVLSLEWGAEPAPLAPDLWREELDRTLGYWDTWVKHCSIPTLYQTETIRSALALKLHCVESTGAILAALTTSLPEEVGAVRNWDYRFCWLRDAYFLLSAFRNLGHFEEMEAFLSYLMGLVENPENAKRLRPVYRLDGTVPLPELEHTNWSGFAASRPVRSGNQAAEHVQNDVYGEMILTLSPVFLDERFRGLRTPKLERMLERLAALCAETISEPDAGLWEIRNGWQEHSFSNLMNWAGLERAGRIRKKGWLQNTDLDVEAQCERARRALESACQEGAVLNGPGDPTADAALLLVAVLNYPDREVCRRTIDRIWHDLAFHGRKGKDAFLFRYLRPDDFGLPRAPFLICSFWLVQALARTGRREEALALMDPLLRSANPLGLFAEHFHPASSHQTGNFPQAYSHAGVINAAFSVSPSWDSLL